MRPARRRTPLSALLVASLALSPLAVAPAVAAPERTAVVAAASLAPAEAVVSIVGELAVGQTVTAEATGWPEGTELSYEWFDGATVVGTGPALPLGPGLEGRVIQVRVTATVPGDPEPVVETVTSANTLKVLRAGTPTVSGTTKVGDTVTAAPGSWTTGTTVRYQWLADGAPIAGATGRTFVLTNAQSGKAVSVAVTGSQPGYPTVTRVSAAAPTRVMRWAVPTIAGTVAAGSTLTAKPGTWTTGTTFTYQWLADGKAISGATSSTLKLGNAHKGKRISVKVVGKKAGHPSATKVSAATGRVATAATPKISGTAVAGGTLTAAAGTWTTGTTLSYRWYADGVAISGATGRTYKIPSSLRDKKITVRVTGKKSGYATVTKTSAATARVQVAPQPKISGTPKVTYTLKANRGTTWSAGTSFSYQWYANGKAISGATGATLKLGPARVGQKITVKVTGRKSGYPTVSRTSAATAAVTYPLRTAPVSAWNCPSWAPIKGNANSGIYHVPSARYYKATKPEDCFRTEAAARAAGYRKAKV
jgi:hypothetical protein